MRLSILHIFCSSFLVLDLVVRRHIFLQLLEKKLRAQAALIVSYMCTSVKRVYFYSELTQKQ